MGRRTLNAPVPGFMKDVIAGKASPVDLQAVAAHFFQLVGGPRRLAKMLVDELNSPRSTPLTRAKIFDLILWLTKTVNDKVPSQGDLGLLTEADLERQWQEQQQRLPDGAGDKGEAGEEVVDPQARSGR